MDNGFSYRKRISTCRLRVSVHPFGHIFYCILVGWNKEPVESDILDEVIKRMAVGAREIPPFIILKKVNQNFPLSTVVQRQLREELLPKTRSSMVLPKPQHLQCKFSMKAYHLKVEAGEESSNCVYFYLSYFCVTWSPRRGRAIDCMNCLENIFPFRSKISVENKLFKSSDAKPTIRLPSLSFTFS